MPAVSARGSWLWEAQLDQRFQISYRTYHLAFHYTMRLINVHTLQLHDFEDPQIPCYCVASHRWTDEEITYEQFSSPQARSSTAFGKIKHFCDFVARLHSQDGSFPEYLWIDTCCIDKRSSAELAKCINSMFRYYRNAHLCLAYLSDVRSLNDFERSKWFKRGWTLQELLAPKAVLFLNSTWEPMGLKTSLEANHTTLKVFTNKRSINDILHKITAIPCNVLRGFSCSRDISVEEKWSWLEGRETKLPEDMAYCMLGIFGVFMPLIYGEGAENARTRLDEEIQRQSRRHLRRTMEGAWEGATNSQPRSRQRDNSWHPMAMLGQDSDATMDLGLRDSRPPALAFVGAGLERNIHESYDRHYPGELGLGPEDHCEDDLK